MNNRIPDFSVSVISTSTQRFFEDLPIINKSLIKRIHADVMDGQFVPRLGLYPEIVSEIRSKTNLAIDVHLMTQDPFQFIGEFAKAGASRVVPHFESTAHPHRLIQEIRSHGMEAGLALNPHTDFEALKYLLPELNVITLMAINPGIVGHKYIPLIDQKISALRKFADLHDFQGQIEIDGGVVFTNVKKLMELGADVLVGGAGTIFHSDSTTSANIEKINNLFS